MKKAVKLIITSIIISIVYVCLSLSPIFFKNYSQDKPKDVKIIAHRGASDIAPENTIASVKSALNLNPDAIEIDVQQTLDSVIVLMHDTTLDRTTNGDGLVKNKTLKHISSLDAGSWFSSDFTNEKIPTLESVLKLIDGKCELIIEIKKGHEFYPNIEEHILKLIKKYNAENWVAIHSFNYKVLETVHNLNPNIKLHKLFLIKFKYASYIISNEIELLNIEKYPYVKEYSINYAFANKSIIKTLKSYNKKVNVWTVNNTDYAHELVALGVDGIITNKPNIIKD